MNILQIFSYLIRSYTIQKSSMFVNPYNLQTILTVIEITFLLTSLHLYISIKQNLTSQSSNTTRGHGAVREQWCKESSTFYGRGSNYERGYITRRMGLCIILLSSNHSASIKYLFQHAPIHLASLTKPFKTQKFLHSEI